MSVIRANGMTLTDDEQEAAERIAKRMRAGHVSLYRASDGLFAYVIDKAGAEHLGVPILRHDRPCPECGAASEQSQYATVEHAAWCPLKPTTKEAA